MHKKGLIIGNFPSSVFIIMIARIIPSTTAKKQGHSIWMTVQSVPEFLRASHCISLLSWRSMIQWLN